MQKAKPHPKPSNPHTSQQILPQIQTTTLIPLQVVMKMNGEVNLQAPITL